MPSFYKTLLLLLFFSCRINSIAAQDISSPFGGFIENRGQLLNQHHVPNREVLFLYHGKGMNIQLRKTGYSYEFFRANNLPGKITAGHPSELLKAEFEIHRVDIDFAGMNGEVKIIASEQLDGFLNYYVSGREAGGVRLFRKVSYQDVFPGTDIDFFITDDSDAPVKYNITLRPGADLNKIKFLAAGADKISVENNMLFISAGSFTVKESIPMSYYADAPGKKKEIFYALHNNVLSFSGSIDANKIFVIDPSSNRIWGTYYGDAATDYCNAVRCDAMNNVYITGYTLNSTNIATNGSYQSVIGGSYDAYIVKFSPSGSRLWGTYFGGSSVETAYSICISSQGFIYICGDTFSTSGIASLGAHQTTYGGGIDDAFLAKFDVSGQRKWSTYYGGALHDFASRVTVDNNGNVLLCGHTESSNNISTNGSYQVVQGGQYDVFIVKFDSLGARQWGTYYGDLNIDEGWGIACDNLNNIYVTGFTSSVSNMATVGSHQPSAGGMNDAFIAKFNPAGTTLNWATFYGGSGDEKGSGIVFSNPGNIYVAGNTTSPNNISSSGSYQQTPGSPDDAFIAKFTLAGIRVWGTYFGGNNVDYIDDIITDAGSSVLVCGSTQSTNVISTAGAYQLSLASVNNYDAYFEKFDAAGVRKLGTYYGGSLQDNAHGIAINAAGHVFLAGETYSSDSMSSPGAFMTAYAGSGDDFLAKFCIAPKPLIIPAGTSTFCTGDTIQLSASLGYSAYSWSNGTTTSSFIQPSAGSGTYYFTVTVNDSYGCSGNSDSVIIIINVCDGIAENDYSALQVFPVPADEVLNLYFTGEDRSEKEITILSEEGKITGYEKISAERFSIDIKKYSPGVYILDVKTGKNRFKRKIILK